MAKYFTKPPLGTPLNPAHPLNRGLVLYMPFSEGAGSKTQDLSGKGNHGTLTNIVQGATSGFSGGKFGGAMNFDGVDDFVQLQSNLIDITTPHTISLFIKNNSTNRGVFFARNSGFPTYEINHHEGGTNSFGFRVGGTGGDGYYTAYATGLSQEKWHHISIIKMSSITSTPTDYSMYIDGVSKNITYAFSTTIENGASNARIGVRVDIGLPFFGNISEVRIYNRALSPLEIQQLYTDPFCMYEQKGISRWAQLIKKGSFFFR